MKTFTMQKRTDQFFQIVDTLLRKTKRSAVVFLSLKIAMHIFISWDLSAKK